MPARPVWPPRSSAWGCGCSPTASTVPSATSSTPTSPSATRRRPSPRGACRCPACGSTPRGRCRSSPAAGTRSASRSPLEGTHLLARAVQHETDHLDGILFVDRLDPEQRREAMRQVREADWARDRPGGQGQPARRRLREALSATRPGRHPRDRGALAATPCSPRRHEVVAVVTRPDARAGRGRTLAPSPVKQVALEHGIEVLTPPTPRDPGVPRAAAPSSPPTAARSSRTAPSCRVRRSTCPPTAGSTCTSRCCPPGAAPPRCSTR